MFAIVISVKFISTIGLLIASAYFLYKKHSRTYWRRIKIYTPPSKSWFGHFAEDMTKTCFGMKVKKIYLEHKTKPLIGLHSFGFLKHLFVNDLDLVRNVLSKDYEYFEGHGFKCKKNANPLDQQMFHMEGEEWKRTRNKLTPTFTSSKMRYMFDTVYACNLEMVEYLKNEVKEGSNIEVREVVAKLGIDVISSIAFGLETNCFKDPDSVFRKMGRKSLELSLWGKLFHLFAFTIPEMMQKIPLVRLPYEVTQLYSSLVEDTINYREKNNIKRKEFLQLLIELRDTKKSPVFAFFDAAFESSALTVQYSLLKLAKNEQIRDKLVAKLDEAVERDNGLITYDLVHALTCLNEVIDETLRLYQGVPGLTRFCTKDYNVPNSDAVIEKGTLVIIPVLGIHHDPDIYPEPDKFNPERFSAENKKSRHAYAHLPFGEGPRICVGIRFAYMQIKIALLSIMLNFKVDLSPKTELPLRFDPNAILLVTEGNMILRFTPRNK